MSNVSFLWGISSWGYAKCFLMLSFFQFLYNPMICFGQLGAPAVCEWFPWGCERNQLPSTPGTNRSPLPCFFMPRGQQDQVGPARQLVHGLPAKAWFNSGLQVHVKFCPVLNCFGVKFKGFHVFMHFCSKICLDVQGVSTVSKPMLRSLIAAWGETRTNCRWTVSGFLKLNQWSHPFFFGQCLHPYP